MPVARTTLDAIAHLAALPLAKHHALCLYTDGSAIDELGLSSWAVAIFRIYEGEAWQFAGYHAGAVTVASDDMQYVGAEAHTSGAAVLFAQAWACLLYISPIPRDCP